MDERANPKQRQQQRSKEKTKEMMNERRGERSEVKNEEVVEVVLLVVLDFSPSARNAPWLELREGSMSSAAPEISITVRSNVSLGRRHPFECGFMIYLVCLTLFIFTFLY